MSTIIQIKRSSGTSAPSTLKLGELAYTYGTGTQGNLGDRLFIGEGGVDSNGDANNITVIGGQYFVDQLDHANGTLTASSALLVDSNKAIDEIFIGNAAAAGGTLKLNEGTNNGTNFIGIKAPNAVTATTTFTLPDGDGSTGQFLKTDGSGNLSFDTITQNLSIAADTGTNDSVSTGETITFTGGEGIDTAVSNNTITISAEDASDSNKGVATFNSADFAVSSGDVTIKSGGVTNTQLAGSIANAKLVNSSITIGSDTVSLGATQTDLNGITSLDVDNITIDGNVVSTTDTNGDLELSPNGTATVIVPSGYESRAGFQSQSLVNKAYVDQVANGLDVKASVRVATTANLAATYNNSNGTLTASANGAISIDGVTLSVGDRVLVKDQTSQVQNGIYKVTTTGGASAAFVLTRTPDADEASEVTGGAFTFVEEGTANADNGYVATHNGTPTLGTTNITFDQFSGAGQISAGDGLSKTGNTIDVNVDDSSIEIASDALQVKALGITNAMLAGSIANAKLTNSTITISDGSASNAVDLGDTLSILGGSGLTSTHSADEISLSLNVDNSSVEISADTLQVKALGITNAMLAGSIANAKLVNDSVTINGSSLALGGTLTLDTADFAENGNLFYTDERVDDRINNLFVAGEGIDFTYDDVSNTFTVDAELASASNKGVASFSSDNFLVSTGVVTVTGIDGGTY